MNKDYGDIMASILKIVEILIKNKYLKSRNVLNFDEFFESFLIIIYYPY